MSVLTDNIDRILAERGIPKGEFYKSVGISSAAYSQWNKEKYVPRKSTVSVIARFLQVTPEYLLTEHYDDFLSDSYAPHAIGDKYDALDDHGKYVVDLVINAEYNRIVTDNKKNGADNIIDIEEARPKLRHYLVSPAAGYISPIEGEDYIDVPYPEDAPEGADYSLTVSGDSMEPYIKDGSIVYVKRGEPLKPYDVGIFFVDGSVYIKQYFPNLDGTLMLLSANPKREDANIIIVSSSDVAVACFGKVLLDKQLPPPHYFH